MRPDGERFVVHGVRSRSGWALWGSCRAEAGENATGPSSSGAGSEGSSSVGGGFRGGTARLVFAGHADGLVAADYLDVVVVHDDAGHFGGKPPAFGDHLADKPGGVEHTLGAQDYEGYEQDEDDFQRAHAEDAHGLVLRRLIQLAASAPVIVRDFGEGAQLEGDVEAFGERSEEAQRQSDDVEVASLDHGDGVEVVVLDGVGARLVEGFAAGLCTSLRRRLSSRGCI